MSNTFFSVLPCAVVLLDSNEKRSTLPGFTPSSFQIWKLLGKQVDFLFPFGVQDGIQEKSIWIGLKWTQKGCWTKPGEPAQALDFGQRAVPPLGLGARARAAAEPEQAQGTAPFTITRALFLLSAVPAGVASSIDHRGSANSLATGCFSWPYAPFVLSSHIATLQETSKATPSVLFTARQVTTLLQSPGPVVREAKEKTGTGQKWSGTVRMPR